MRAVFTDVFGALKHLDGIIHKSRAVSAERLRFELSRAVLHIKDSRPYSPILRHCLNYVLHAAEFENVRTLREQTLARIQKAGLTVGAAQRHAIEAGAMKLRSGSTLATVGFDPLVHDMLVSARAKNLTVNVVAGGEQCPGEEFAKNLAMHKLASMIYPDAAARQAVKGADFVLLGCTVITAHSVVAPMGGELLAELAHARGIPVYIAAIGLQYDPRGHESVEGLPAFAKSIISKTKGPARFVAHYEHIDPELVSGVISELGVFSHARFMDEAHHRYPWMFV